MEDEKVIVDNNEGGEGDAQENITLAKADYDKLNQTLGSLKRELKDLKKPKEEVKETPKETKPDESKLLDKLERMALRQAGIDHSDDMDLARNTAKKWNMDIDEVLVDEDFKAKLERQQTKRTNEIATSGIKGGAGKSTAKETAEYWIAKGVPPSPTDIPDRKTRGKIAKAFIASTKSSKQFYND